MDMNEIVLARVFSHTDEPFERRRSAQHPQVPAPVLMNNRLGTLRRHRSVYLGLWTGAPYEKCNLFIAPTLFPKIIDEPRQNQRY